MSKLTMLFSQPELFQRKRRMNSRNRKTELVLNYPEIAKSKKLKLLNNSTRNFRKSVSNKSLKMRD